ncbi:hypothetical protein [Cytophaga hutchinsonii]|uniref:Uncharacterized protein n=1 Tax=Cytophaga hutchinsonii (strain ATCC 33406 / DSM 1761 / CIP 103989 / NBRC 15051 / NCIMB 9469 / D465) TaxID=269798 RepID=A0A6N4SWN4_CYTH3|nr:hypothetical protein [Cytophaga hutchinsonii]ABG60907.1 hypothetical protein CHU_3674 [Cytophaga hutchinsonii ATCC 33406]SFX42263.1 hypothetical protein SAMN04487930_10421 [Cytophaga hutchinsonii ATCC 33406]
MIQIKNPCDADWQKMTPDTAGKFCSSCEKVVVDFSKMSDTEIKDYFIVHFQQKTCGRFLTSQVDRELKTDSKNYFHLLFNTFSGMSAVRSVVLLLASSLIWLSSCVKKHSPATLGEPAYTGPDSENRLMGDTVIMDVPEDTTALIPQEDTLEMHAVGIVAPMITGKVRMTDTITQRIKKRK